MIDDASIWIMARRLAREQARAALDYDAAHAQAEAQALALFSLPSRRLAFFNSWRLQFLAGAAREQARRLAYDETVTITQAERAICDQAQRYQSGAAEYVRLGWAYYLRYEAVRAIIAAGGQIDPLELARGTFDAPMDV